MSEDDPFAPPAPGQQQPPPVPPRGGQQWQPPPGWGQPSPYQQWGQQQWGQPQWGQQQWGYPPAAPGTNGLAIASLVTGLLPLPPVAIGTGIGALVQTRRSGQSGRGLAIAGIVLGGLWSLLIAGFVVAGITGSFDPQALGQVSQAGSTTVGSCLLDPGTDSGRWEETDCSQAHDAEVYLAGPLPFPSYPGGSDVATSADDVCYGAFQGYVGEDYESSDYEYGFFVPDEVEWDGGEHRVVCVVLGDLQGTVRA